MGEINSGLKPNSKTKNMNKLVILLLVGFAFISLSAGNEEDKELVEIENTDMMKLENLETLELAEPEAMPKKKGLKKKRKNRKNRKNRKTKNEGKGRSLTRANTACATNINKYLFYLAKAVVIFDKQIKRAEVKKTLTGK